MNLEKDVINLTGQIEALHDLLQAMKEDHFGMTMDGARKQYQAFHDVHDEREQSYWWMNGHFDSLSAAVGAAVIIAENAEKAVYTMAGVIANADREVTKRKWNQENGHPPVGKNEKLILASLLGWVGDKTYFPCARRVFGRGSYMHGATFPKLPCPVSPASLFLQRWGRGQY